MSLTVLIIKTGSTIASLKAQGEDFEDWFAEGLALSADQILVSEVFRGEALPEISGIAGIVITGSPAYVTDEEAWNFSVADYCKEAHQRGIPMLGVCYGHQLLAWAFGGEVGFNPKGREIGTVTVELTKAAELDPLLGGAPQQLVAQASHLQSVLQLPAEAIHLGGNACDPHHAFRLGDSTWCLQFHPEFSAEITRAYIRERSAEITAEGLDPELLERSLQESPHSAALLPRFMQLVQAAQS